MRIDHHAYQRATRAAGLGLLLQAAMGVLLLAFGILADDTAFRFASFYVLIGVLVWLGLVVIFHQHKLERLEALEEDELAASRAEASSVFEQTALESRVAARRLAQMHKWLMPALSLIIAAALIGLAWLMINFMRQGGEFQRSAERGWAVAICLSLAAVSFIFSRFVAGMAKQHVWQNIRGGAAYMAGNALLLVAVAIGIICRFFDNEQVIRGLAWGIPVFMALLAVEIVLNFVLNLYRPRVPGEVPRPAFDSKVLSLLATPDNIVRSLNEAVNYQFGFDVTSSWGYQLLLRSFIWLLCLGVAALVLLSAIVVVEPHQQAIKLRSGRIVGEAVHESGIMWKWPWPIETAVVRDVARVRDLHLTAKVLRPPAIGRWSQETPATDEKLDPFLVGSAALQVERMVQQIPGAGVDRPAEQPTAAPAQAERKQDDQSATVVSNFYSLVDAEIILSYRIRRDNNGLLDYLNFASESVARRQNLSDRERALKSLALEQVSRHLSSLTLDEVLSPGRAEVAGGLTRWIQASFDEHRAGVEVVALTMPMLRPSGGAASTFEELGISVQARRQATETAQQNVFATFTHEIGNAALAPQVLAGIDDYDRAAGELGKDAPETIEKRQAVERLLLQGAGQAAQRIAAAETSRWTALMAKRAQASQVQSQRDAYRASPVLYQQREQMLLYKRLLPVMRKFIVAIDPARLSLDADLKELNPYADFYGASEEEMKKK